MVPQYRTPPIYAPSFPISINIIHFVYLPLFVIEESTPSVVMNEQGTITAKQGTSTTLTCTLKGQTGDLVKGYSLTWTTGKFLQAFYVLWIETSAGIFLRE